MNCQLASDYLNMFKSFIDLKHTHVDYQYGLTVILCANKQTRLDTYSILTSLCESTGAGRTTAALEFVFTCVLHSIRQLSL